MPGAVALIYHEFKLKHFFQTIVTGHDRLRRKDPMTSNKDVGQQTGEEDEQHRHGLEHYSLNWPNGDGHTARLAAVGQHRHLNIRLQKTKRMFGRYGNTVYIGTFLFVLVFVFTIGASWRQSKRRDKVQANQAILNALSRHAQKLLPYHKQPGPMNVIFIVADDLGWNDIGYRNKDLTTPNLDRLAREGVILNQSYVQSTCSPSRAAILTGYYPHRLGLQHRTITREQAKFIPLNIPTLAEELKIRGYATHAVGKWHVGHCNWQYTPTKRGFDSHFGYFLASEDYYDRVGKGVFDFWNNTAPAVTSTGIYSTDLFAATAVDLIHRHAYTRTDPLFLYLAFQSIHGPLNQPPKQYTSPRNNKKTKPVRYVVHDMVMALDAAVGRVVRALEETGMMRNTLLVFTSDNGGALDTWGDNAPLRGGKFSQWEGGTRAITFIHGPMIKYPGREFNGLFHAVDWSPTILAAVDRNRQKIPRARTDGINQWKMLVENIAGPTRDDIVYVLDEVDGTYVYRYGRFKLMVGPSVCRAFKRQMMQSGGPDANCWHDSFKKRRGISCKYKLGDTMLFDVGSDPTEQYDLSAQKPDLVNALKRRLEELKKDMVPNQSNDKLDISGSIENNILYPGWC
jgi:arylsulfatase A-like enzyme